MKNRFNTEFYSNKRGELFAFVSEIGGEHRHRLISNIEGFRYTPEMLDDEARRGFDSFPCFDIWDYDGVDFAVTVDNLIFDNELDYIGFISERGKFLNYSKMNKSVRALFLPNAAPLASA